VRPGHLKSGNRECTRSSRCHGSQESPRTRLGRFNQAVRKLKNVDERTKYLIELKGAQMIGCEYCVDLGSQICRNSGLSDEEHLALPDYRSSDLLTDREKVALDYTVPVMRAPAEVSDELLAWTANSQPSSQNPRPIITIGR
jgi:AhpD family alkylhydroperoxidase